MAPVAPKLSIGEHRMARLRGDIHPHAPYRVHREETTVSDSFASSKRDKRMIKKSAFVSKISKANAKPSRNATRRANKKLKTTLDGLADALPELDSDDDMGLAAAASGKIKHKSLKSRPGALKRKEKLVKTEMHRFGASMAQLATIVEKPPPAPAPAKPVKLSRKQQRLQNQQGAQQQQAVPAPAPQVETSTANRWAALRGYISATMEQNAAFVNKS